MGSDVSFPCNRDVQIILEYIAKNHKNLLHQQQQQVGGGYILGGEGGECESKGC